jgi:hypothetical protein
VPPLLLGRPFFPIILFLSTTLLTGTTGISLHVQWPLTSQVTKMGSGLHFGRFLQKNLVTLFCQSFVNEERISLFGSGPICLDLH